MKKRIVSVALSAVMLLSTLPPGVLAAEAEPLPAGGETPTEKVIPLEDETPH